MLRLVCSLDFFWLFPSPIARIVLLFDPLGIPASAATREASKLPLSWAKGEMVHPMRRGRWRRAYSPPAMAAAIFTVARASRSE